MSRISPIDPAVADSHAKPLFDAVRSALGLVPNMMRTMAVSPPVLEGFLSLNSALAKGKLNAATRARIALAVSQKNGCAYCVSAHTLLGNKAGLTDADMLAARAGKSTDAKADAIVKLAVVVTEKKGAISPSDFDAARNHGVSDAEIAETVANVAINVFTNYFNLVAETAIDFPKIEL